jgi:predicted neuraminidase
MMRQQPVTVMTATTLGQIWAGIPGVEVTPRGRLFVTCFSGGAKEPEPQNTIFMTVSDGLGHPFAQPTVIATPGDDGTRAFDPTLWRDPRGRLWLIFNRGNKDTAQHSVHARLCADPDAAHPVWSAERRLDLPTPYAFRMNKPTVLSTGEWLMPVTHALTPIHEWFAGPVQVQGVAISHDEGLTWTLHGAVEAPAWALENMILEHRDGTLSMYIRTGSGVLWRSMSLDRGRSWSPGTPTDITNPGSRFFLGALPDGDWLLINSPLADRRTGLVASLSSDEGRSWHGRLVLDERDEVSYPDAAFAADGTIYAVHDRDRAGVGEILLSAFRRADIGGSDRPSPQTHGMPMVNARDIP